MKQSTWIVASVPTILLSGALGAAAEPAKAENDFLQVRDTHLYLHGKPFYEISFNKFDLFWQMLDAEFGRKGHAHFPPAIGTEEILNGDASDTSYQKTVANLAQGKPTLCSQVYSGVMLGLRGTPNWGLFTQDKAANFMYQKLDWQAVGEELGVKPGWVELTLDARDEGLVTVKELAGGFRYVCLGCYSESTVAPVWFDNVVVTEDQP